MKSLLKMKDKHWSAIMEEAEDVLDSLDVKLAWSDHAVMSVDIPPDAWELCVEVEPSKDEL